MFIMHKKSKRLITKIIKIIKIVNGNKRPQNIKAPARPIHIPISLHGLGKTNPKHMGMLYDI
jgi:hypothetical protein